MARSWTRLHTENNFTFIQNLKPPRPLIIPAATPLAFTGSVFEEAKKNSIKPSKDLNLKIEWSKVITGTIYKKLTLKNSLIGSVVLEILSFRQKHLSTFM